MLKTSAARTSDAPFSVKISPRGVDRLHSGHPWVYRSDVAVFGDVPKGALVGVTDPRGKFLGSALYSSSSQIAIRMISRDRVSNLPNLVAERIRAAISFRERTVASTNAYRLIFSEADFLPGLIVDCYNDVISVQILTQAMDTDPVRTALLQTLSNDLNPVGIVERVDGRIRDLEQLSPRQSGLLCGEKSSTVIRMNFEESPGTQAGGVQFHYDGLEGQKTGAFLDQRENYAAAARHAHGEGLDVFCYQGGFALHLAEKCSSVTGVDSSRPALEMAEKNAALNRRELEWIEGNAFDLLKDYDTAKRRYDTIVLDPPAFAKSKNDLEKAMRGYKELNLRALKMLRPGGILVTCSCSFHVSSQEFLGMVSSAAADAHRQGRILESRGQALDHPVLLNVPETSYLKCLVVEAK
ncbi:MAG: SAM-dependent methyltransferase [Acidobacteria bacterium]|jgi:23S rRNA (cytosine1962-C5)-methyltransferase|nr:MAG: SAM-dependent methyltransferase [Acidobacteriota bacterium]